MRSVDDKGSARLDVTCATYREALSAQLDGELPPVDSAFHVARCAECAAWARDVPAVLRPLRMRPADEVPDLTERILAAIIGTVPRPSWILSLTRAALMAVALAQLVVALTQFLGGAQHGSPHAAAESGAWNLAMGIALATAALRPRVAYVVLPMVASLVIVLVLASVRDLGSGAVEPQRVLAHSLIVVGLGLISALAWRMRQPGRAVTPGPLRADRVPARGLMPR